MGWSYESSGSQTDRALLQEAESLSRRYAESGLSSQQFAAALSTGLGVSNRSDRAALTDAIKGALRAGGSSPAPTPPTSSSRTRSPTTSPGG
jgi:conjugal transfer mating pair stabilization protein TraG